MKNLSVIAVAIVAMVALPAMVQAGETRTYDITNDRRQKLGSIYDPGTGDRLQIRDNQRRIIGYIEKDGTITDSRRRKVGEIDQ